MPRKKNRTAAKLRDYKAASGLQLRFGTRPSLIMRTFIFRVRSSGSQ